MIGKKNTIKISKNSATLSKDISLFRTDKNIDLYFEIVNNDYKFDKNDLDNNTEVTKAPYSQVILYKDDEINHKFDAQPTDNGNVVLTIEETLIDEAIEVGDYDFQIILLDENKQSQASLPIIRNQFHVCEPLMATSTNTDTLIGNVVLGATIIPASEIKDAFDENGNYIREVHVDGEPLTAQKVNKFENALAGNTRDLKNIKNQLGSEELTTTAKNIKAAINEHDSQIKEKASNSDLSELETLIGKGVTDTQIKNAIQSKIDDGTITSIQIGENSVNKNNVATDSIGLGELNIHELVDKNDYLKISSKGGVLNGLTPTYILDNAILNISKGETLNFKFSIYSDDVIDNIIVYGMHHDNTIDNTNAVIDESITIQVNRKGTIEVNENYTVTKDILNYFGILIVVNLNEIPTPSNEKTIYIYNCKIKNNLAKFKYMYKNDVSSPLEDLKYLPNQLLTRSTDITDLVDKDKLLYDKSVSYEKLSDEITQFERAGVWYVEYLSEDSVGCPVFSTDKLKSLSIGDTLNINFKLKNLSGNIEKTWIYIVHADSPNSNTNQSIDGYTDENFSIEDGTFEFNYTLTKETKEYLQLLIIAKTSDGNLVKFILSDVNINDISLADLNYFYLANNSTKCKKQQIKKLDTDIITKKYLDYALSNYVPKTKYTGKVIGTFGDSLTDGYIYTNNTRYDNNEGKYQQTMIDLLGCETINFGSSGGDILRTWEIVKGTHESQGWDSHSEWYKPTPNFSEMDAVTIMIGTNEIENGQQGSIDDLSGDDYNLYPETYYGTYGKCIEYMLEHNPRLRIYLMTPPWCDRGYIGTVANRVREIANYYHLPVIDCYAESGLNKYNQPTYMPDKLHQNPEGAKVLGTYIANQMTIK